MAEQEQKNPVDIMRELGVNVQTVPENLHPGDIYTTPNAIADSQVFRYTRQRIHQLIQEGRIASHQIGSHRLITEQGIIQLLDIAIRHGRFVPPPGIEARTELLAAFNESLEKPK